MPCEDYLILNIDCGKVYVRKDCIENIRRIDGVIFDCDGVLIDIRDSYDKSIFKSVVYILERMTGRKVSEEWISKEIIHLFRKAGGFNNDWDTVYGILMFILSSLPKEARRCLEKIMKKNEKEESPFKRLMLINEAVKEKSELHILNRKFFLESVRNLKEFTNLLDPTGRESIDKNLMNLYGSDKDFRRFYALLKRFLHGADDVEKSIIAKVFEEFFCGATLFIENYRSKPEFNKGPGLIENEKLIVQPKTLDALVSILGKRNLGIASGSRCKIAEYVLGNLIDKFNPKAIIFLEDVEMAERECLWKENLRKPHPFSLLKAAEGLENSNFTLYVGDSMEDALMASEAVKLGRNILFAGVYRYTGFEKELTQSFLDYGCDLIIPTVNELPIVLEKLRGEKY